MSQHTLTSEEMRPYVDRVLQHPLNWMVHSMALLFRCRLEYGNYMTQQRATFQMQALVDQHTNELTMLQNNDQIIEDSAPVQERLQFAHLLEFPLRWELQRELGRCWVKMGGVKSAMEIFTSLYMWSDVVSCLMALKKKKRAETLLRQLLSKRKTPELLCVGVVGVRRGVVSTCCGAKFSRLHASHRCLLGEVLDSDEPYQEAWEVSEHRHVYAIKALAHRHHKRGDTAKALECALVRELVPGGWLFARHTHHVLPPAPGKRGHQLAGLAHVVPRRCVRHEGRRSGDRSQRPDSRHPTGPRGRRGMGKPRIRADAAWQVRGVLSLAPQLGAALVHAPTF